MNKPDDSATPDRPTLSPPENSPAGIPPGTVTLEEQIAQLQMEVQSVRKAADVPRGPSWRAAGLLALVPVLAVLALAWWWRPAASLPGPTLPRQKLTFHKWKKGDPRIKLIRAEEGFCFLTSVNGHFQGGGETLAVRIEQDGYWYFGGSVGSEWLAGECAVYRFDQAPAVLAPAAVPTPPTATVVAKGGTEKPETLVTLRDQLLDSLRGDIAKLRNDNPENSEGILRLTKAIDHTQREFGILDAQHPDHSRAAALLQPSVEWKGIMQAFGSEKSAALAFRLADLVQTGRGAAVAAEAQRHEELGQRAKALFLQSKNARDFDPLVEEFTKIGALPPPSGSSRTRQGEIGRLAEFIWQWQKYLKLSESGQQREAMRVWRGLRFGEQKEIRWIPEAEAIARLEAVARLGGWLPAAEMKMQIPAIVEKALAVREVAELNPLLSSARAWQKQLGDERDVGDAADHVQALVHFLDRWQAFRTAQAEGNPGKLRDAVMAFRGNFNGTPLDLPRARLIDRIYAVSAAAKMADNLRLEKPETVLARIRKADDMAANLEVLEIVVALENEGRLPGDRWRRLILELHALQNQYVRAKNGEPLPSASGDPGREPLLAALRREIGIVAVQRMIGEEATKVSPKDGEDGSAYLRRLLAGAQERKDWRLVQRILEADARSVKDALWKPGDTAAIGAFMVGLKQELAQQFAPAVVSYQTALKSDSTVLPVDEVRERLALIKKEHPDDFEKGLAWSGTAPSAPATPPAK